MADENADDDIDPDLQVRFEDILAPLMHRLATAKVLGAAFIITPDQVGMLRDALKSVSDAGQRCQERALANQYTRHQIVVLSRDAAAVLGYGMWVVGWLYAWIVLKVVL